MGRRVGLIVVALVVSVMGTTVWGDPYIESISPNSAERGETVIVEIFCICPDAPWGCDWSCTQSVSVELISDCEEYYIDSADDYDYSLPGRDTFSLWNVSFTIPDDAPLGTYTVRFRCISDLRPLTSGFTISCSSSEYEYGGGTGTPADPYHIRDANDMQAIGANPCDWDKDFILLDDIDLSQFDGKDGRESFNVIGDSCLPFTGVFDGNNHRILNVTIDYTGDWVLGLFGQISGEQSEVRNLGLQNTSVSGGEYSYVVGGLCGYNYYGTVMNCYSTGKFYAEYIQYIQGIGGLVGYNEGAINNCYSAVSIDWGSSELILGGVGGLCGYNDGTIGNCYATGSATGVGNVGGLCGFNGFTISNCFWDTETSRQDWSDGGTGLPTSQLHQQSTFTDWDFIGVWNIGENQTYPYLRTFSAADIDKNRVVNFCDYALICEEWMEEE